jgi:NADPH:quinone reductase-like Zn-dependent oxidoreductase
LNYRDHLVLSDATGVWRDGRDLVPVADGAGVVDAVGNGVDQWSTGDRVMTVYLRRFPHWPPNAGMGMGLGSFDEDGVLAEYIVLPADRFVRVPPHLTLAEASTFPCAAVTAWTGLQHAHPLQRGHKALMLGSGGVSLFAISFARAMGAEVYVTTSRPDKNERLRELGAAGIVDYRLDPDWGKTVFRATGGVDKVINTAGLGSVNQSIEALAFGGDIAVIGLLTFGDAIDPAAFLAKGVSLRGIPVGSREQHQQMIDFVERHGIRPVIHKRFGFDDIKAAYAAQLSPGLFGKIVITVADESAM